MPVFTTPKDSLYIMKIDLHLHTNLGSSCSYMDPDQLITRAKSVGLDGVCLTDHDHIWSEDQIKRLQDKHGFLVVGGSEISTDVGDVLVFGFHESVRKIFDTHELRELLDECDGVMILAHPFRFDPGLVGRFLLQERKITRNHLRF